MVTRVRFSGLLLGLLASCGGTTVGDPEVAADGSGNSPTAGAGSAGGNGGSSSAGSGSGSQPSVSAGASGKPNAAPATPDPAPAKPSATPITPDATPVLPEPTAPTTPPAAYDGQGFVVHEWGTNTVVSASNGTLQAGLHHEEEDLPGFVYDRLKSVAVEDIGTTSKVVIKMETPVLYFYAPSSLTVHASVGFPSGVLTQWYPGVSSFLPPIEWTIATSPPRDGAMGPTLATPNCIEKYQKNGLLDWGAFELLGTRPATETLPHAPLDEFTWGYAREVASNAVRFPDGETEQFLFYRGLSNVELPATTRALGGGRLSIENHATVPLGATFVVDVRSDSGAFNAYSGGVGASATAELEAPAEGAQLPLEAFVTSLGSAVTAALDATGLYHDEAVAMVNTWSRQWFRTPGLRVFYLAPQTWTDAVLPLTLEPTPASLVRVMVVRVELLTPEVEAVDASAADRFSSDEAAARAHFAALGRFGEPRLRRALELVPSAAGEAYLATLVPEFQRASGLGE
jgi:hypothetical protein